MMKKVICLVAVAIGLLSCSEKETPGGVKFTVLKKGDGEEIATGQMIVLNIILANTKDSVVLNTFQDKMPRVMPMPDASMASDPGEYGVFKMLTKGDCIAFKLSAKTYFTKRRRPVPKTIDPNGFFTYTVQLKDVWSVEQAKAYEQEVNERMVRKQFSIDSTRIADYLKAKGWDAKSTQSGLRYIVHKEGKGKFPQIGKVANVHYAGFLLDGKIFDTSIAAVATANKFDNGGRNTPYPVPLGAQRVIAGWEEIIQLMNPGTKLTVFIPSALAYGWAGRDIIPPNAPLMFDMELVDFK